MKDYKVVCFKSEPRKTIFAPEWEYYIFESFVNKFNFKNLAKLIVKKERSILKLPMTKRYGKVTDGFTGLGENSTTIRFESYNVLKWKNTSLLKKSILKGHAAILNFFKQETPKELYIQCWANIMRKGEQIKPHIHSTTPTTYLGGHLCVQCDQTSTHYINPINQINDPEIYSSKNETGKITFFPNNIPHYTDIQNSDNERITIAFDLAIHKPNTGNWIKLI